MESQGFIPRVHQEHLFGELQVDREWKPRGCRLGKKEKKITKKMAKSPVLPSVSAPEGSGIPISRFPKSTADPAGYPGVKLAVLAVLNQLTVWSAAWWCHLAALCPWLSDCILYPGPTGRAGSHPLSSYLRRQRENLAGTTLPAG